MNDFTRKVLHIASIVGHTFSLIEIVGISEHVFSINEEEKNSHAKEIRYNLELAVDGGIIEEISREDLDSTAIAVAHLHPRTLPEPYEEKNGEPNDSCYHYQFCHDVWRQKILSLLLDSYKRDVHTIAARMYEAYTLDALESDCDANMKLFRHLKESGNASGAADWALVLGKKFTRRDLNLHSIRLYDEALDSWRRGQGYTNDCNSIVGFPPQVIDSINKDDLTSIIKLLTALGQTFGSLSRQLESARAFESALEVSGIVCCISSPLL